MANACRRRSPPHSDRPSEAEAVPNDARRKEGETREKGKRENRIKRKWSKQRKSQKGFALENTWRKVLFAFERGDLDFPLPGYFLKDE